MKTAQELLALQELAEEYQKLDYAVVVEPPATLIPAFLGDYRPELLATKDGENLLFDVKLEGARDVAEFWRMVAEVKRHAGWKLTGITVPNVDPEVNTSGVLSDLDVEGLRQQLREIDLWSRDPQRRSVILPKLWVVYIAALRLLAIQEGFDRDGDADYSRLVRAQSNGLISNAEREEGRALMILRNRVVNGSDAVVAPEDCLQLRQMIQRVIDQIAPVETPETAQHVEA
ncbi:hypothetical protein NHH82_05020 [Oxalobacteraceae bacterium OTU3REALA1]|nr:hypothetical protein NHH82_05020 [Oxalobacteraceae bacterium OTU3REALA1]